MDGGLSVAGAINFDCMAGVVESQIIRYSALSIYQPFKKLPINWLVGAYAGRDLLPAQSRKINKACL